MSERSLVAVNIRGSIRSEKFIVTDDTPLSEVISTLSKWQDASPHPLYLTIRDELS